MVKKVCFVFQRNKRTGIRKTEKDFDPKILSKLTSNCQIEHFTKNVNIDDN